MVISYVREIYNGALQKLKKIIMEFIFNTSELNKYIIDFSSIYYL